MTPRRHEGTMNTGPERAGGTACTEHLRDFVPSWLNALPCALALVLSLALVGCQSAKVERTVTADHGGVEPDAQLDFWHTLADQPVTSNDDAFHGLLLFLDGTD